MKHAARYDCMEEPTCDDDGCIFWTICNKYREQKRIDKLNKIVGWFDAYVENLDEEHARIIQARGM